MKLKSLLTVFVAIIGSLWATNTFALSGSYTIDPAGSGSSNYTSVAAAASALVSGGVTGPCVFTIADGTYSGQVSFSTISGVSSTNTVKFVSKSGKPRKCVITHNGSYTIYNNGGDYITFERVSIINTATSYNIYMYNADYNMFNKCRILGLGSTYTTYNVYQYYGTYNTWKDCRVQGGYYAFYMYGSGSGSSASKGNAIINCDIVKHYYYGSMIYYQREMTFSNNYIDSCTNSGYGLMAYYSDKFEAHNNEIFGCYYGMYLYYHNQYGSSSDTSKFYNNIVRNNVYYGMYSYYIPRCNFYHNVFDGGSGNYSAIFQYCAGAKVLNNIFTGDGLYYGFYCYYSSTGDAPALWDYNDYWFNSPTYFGVFMYYAYSTFSDLKSAYSNYNQNCVTVDPGFTSKKDGRTYAPGLNNIGKKTVARTDIDGNKRPNANDKPKVDIGPNDFYLAPYDLDVYALVNPLSVSLSSNTITAQFRNSGSATIASTSVEVAYSVDSGKTWTKENMSISSLAPGKVQQYDFSTKWTPKRSGYFGIFIKITKSVSGDPDLLDQKNYYVCSGLAGKFTIGNGKKTNFKTFADALKALNCGVAGPITFEVRPGTYNERVLINTLNGASATNTVTFHSAHRDSVTIQYTATSTSNQNTIEINGADYVAFENMKIQANGTSYGFAVHLMNQANYNRFSNCLILASLSAVSTYSIPVVLSNSENSYYGYGDNGNYNLFENNDIQGGYFGVCVMGQSTSAMSEGNQFIGNKITKSYYYGMYFYYVSGLIFNDNRVEDFRYQYNYALYMIYVSNYQLQRNYFKSYYGNIFEMANYYNYKGTRSIIANNMFTGDNTSYALDGYYMSYTDFWHNSLYGKGSYLLYWYYVRDIDVRNNIFYYGGSSYVMYAYGANFKAWDYNDYYITGGQFYVGTSSYTSVSSLKSYNPNFNQNNFEEDPQWVDPTSNLHITKKFPEMYGTKVGVELDHDKDKRCKFAPTIGADEFQQSALPPVANFLAPDTAWLGSAATMLNANKASKLAGATWYVNGKFMSDSIHLVYTPKRAGYDTVSLVMENCSGRDSISKLVFVSPILRAPKVDFSASSRDIYTGDILTLFDLSENGATEWSWSISPVLAWSDFLGMWERAYYWNDSTKSNPQVNFMYPGVYEVCLKVSNSYGADSVCRKAYIKVRQKAVMCDIIDNTDGSYGTLFDNGGEFGNYSPGLTGISHCTYTISSCKGEIDLDISMFDLGQNDYLKIYDGTDENSRPLWDAAMYPDGMTGNKSDASVKLSLTAQSGSAYFVFESDNNANTVGKGFAIDWEINPVTWTAPTADINHPDTACTGFPTYFENTSTGNWSWVEWDLNNDGSIDGGSNDFNYTFNTAGTYQVKLIAHSLCAARDSIISTIVVEGAKKAPTPVFSATKTVVSAGDTLTLSENSRYCSNKTEWSITPANYLLANNSSLSDSKLDVVFTRGGFYTIRLVKGNSFGTDTLTKINYIQVLDYCTPAVVNLDEDVAISRVIFNTIDNKSNSGVNGYNNFLKMSTNVERGQSYDLTIERATNSKTMTRKAWVDWNIDGDFDDAGELIAYEAPATTLSYTESVTIPATASPGKTRMRVAVNYKNLTNSACGPNQFGEYEDYTIVIDNGDNSAPTLTLDGKTEYTFEVGSAWTEPGFSASDLIDGNLTAKVSISTSLDMNVLGTYTITYSVSDAAGNITKAERIVHIVDTQAPALALNGSDTVYVEVNTAYTEDGVTITDNYDKALSASTAGNVDNTTVGTYMVSYCVTDNSGNGPVCAERVVIVQDTETPVIALVGNSTETVEVFHAYADAGYTLSDNDMAHTSVATSGTWTGSTAVLGTYTLTYTAMDAANPNPNTASVTRTIEIVDTEAPVLKLNGNAVEYIERWSAYTDAGFTVSDNYDVVADINVVTGGDFVNTLSNGIYTITYTATDKSNNSATTVTRTIVVESTLGIDEMSAESVTVYPNPSTGRVSLLSNINSNEMSNIRVFDATGREVMAQRTVLGQGTVVSFDFTAFEAGVYYIQVNGESFHAMKPVTITR